MAMSEEPKTVEPQRPLVALLKRFLQGKVILKALILEAKFSNRGVRD